MSDDIADIMLEVAKAIADRAKATDQPPFAEQIDALKALTAMYTAMQKHPIGDKGEEDDGFSFDKGIDPQEDQNDSATVAPLRARRRPG